MAKSISSTMSLLLLLVSVAAFWVNGCQGCGADSECPGDCENKYKCVDRSDLCEQMKDQCENFFFRKCMRCACPKTCGVCSDSSSSSEEDVVQEQTSTTMNSTTTTTTTILTTTTTATAANTTTPSTTTIASSAAPTNSTSSSSPITTPTTTASPSSSSPSPTTPEPSSSPSPTPSSTPEPTSEATTEAPTTVEAISDAEFNDPVKMKCKTCDAKRKKLAEIYDKYYPK